MQKNLKASSSQQEALIGPYRILKTLGTGNFAQVKLAVHLHTEVQVALKTLEKDKKNATLISNELEIMKLVDHPNITRLFHVMETTEHICMVMEYASGGDLAGRIIEVSYIHEEEARHIFTQIVCAVNYCHVNGIAHRDIKPENILMDANRNIKLCDFGLAIKVNTEQKSTVFCGTLPYCAPELFSIQSYDPRALDIWSMGVVLYIMVTKHYPFKATTYDKMKEEMQDPHYYIPPKLPAHVASLIVQLFTIDPVQRPKIGDIMEHQWLQGSEEFSKKILSQETLTGKPNPSIMAAMGAMGYNPKDITDSLYKKKFNSIMATYLILKHQSPCTDSANHKVKLKQPSINMIPTDPPTVHLFLKKIGSKTDNATSASPAKDQSHKDDKLVKKDSKNHGMTDDLSCQQMSLPCQTPAQCGPVQHPQELLLNSSLQKRGTASSAVACGPVQCDHEQLLNKDLQKRNMACSAVSCGPGQSDHEQLLNKGLQKRGVASKAVSCGPGQHDHGRLLSSSSLQKRGMVSKAVSYGPGQHDDQHPLNSSSQKRSTASSAVPCGPGQHDDQHPLNSSSQKRSTASSGVSCGPGQHDDQHPLNSSSQKRSTASSAVPCGPGQHDDQHPLSSSSQKRSTASSAVSCGPGQHDDQHPLNSSSQKRSTASSAVSCGPGQHDDQHPPSSSSQKRSTASSAVSYGLVQHDDQHPLNSSLQKKSTASSAVSYGPVQHDDEHPPSSHLQKRNVASRAVSCGPVHHDHEQLLNSRLQKGGVVSKAVSCGPVQYDHGQLLSSSSLQKGGVVSKAVSCGPGQHDHGRLLSSSLQKRSTASSAVSCSLVEYDDEQPLSSSLQRRNTASSSVFHDSVECGHEQFLSSSLQKGSTASHAAPCDPVEYDDQQPLSSSLQKRGVVSKAMSCGPVQYVHEQLLSSRLRNRSMTSKLVSCGSMQHDHEQLLSSSLQKKSMVSKTVSCGPVQYEEQLFKGNLQRRSTVSRAVSYGPVLRLNSSLQKRSILSKGMARDSPQHGREQLLSSSVQKRITLASSDVSSGTATSVGILSEYHISHEDPQGESRSKCSSCLHNIASVSSVWSSEEMIDADSHHKDRRLSLQETSEPNFASAQAQCVTMASPRSLSGGWTRAKRRMVKCLRRLCCCLPAQRRSCTSQRRVVPQKAGESGVTQNQVSGDSGVTQNQVSGDSGVTQHQVVNIKTPVCSYMYYMYFHTSLAADT